ncbi:MAG: hypothetical protein ACD_5C00064G0001 [uncultured bacterium]|nr:MAG: hypothetical protein ACD_5C00064G0001 [uncultured bacterium]
MNNPCFDLIRTVWKNGQAHRRAIVGYQTSPQDPIDGKPI